VVTEGVLTRRLQHDPELPGVGVVIFDEVHERNLPTDLGLALALDVRAALRPDLRILAMSATPDTRTLVRLLEAHPGGDGVAGPGTAPVIESEGREFPVEIRSLPPAKGVRTEQATAEAVLTALRDEPGDVLVFLPGIGEIRRVEGLLAGRVPDHVDVRPLAGALSLAEQDLALTPSPEGRRRVVLSTDIAESSLTVAGVRRRGRRRPGPCAPLRPAHRHDAAHHRHHQPGVGRPALGPRRPHRAGRVLPPLEQARAEHPSRAPARRDHPGRPRRPGARARRVAGHTRVAAVPRPTAGHLAPQRA
jgi:hypothetical protein